MSRVYLLCCIAVMGFLCGCSSQGGPAPAAALPADGGRAAALQPRAGGLDQVSAMSPLDLGGATVYVAPLEIDYRSTASQGKQPLGFSNRTLDAGARARLQETMAQAFAERFLSARGGRLVSDAGGADYTLHLRLEKFYLPAPLEQTTRLREVFSESSAYGTLSGTLSDARGGVVLQFRDRREFGEDFPSLGPGRLQRFSPPSFWADMRMDLRRAFGSLHQSVH